MFKAETRYALHAASILAGSGDLISTRELAERMQLSGAMVAKILHQLTLAGLVRGRPGPGGGYRLQRPAGEIPLMEIVELGEGREWGLSCLLGLPECNDEHPCALHQSWGALRDRIRSLLASYTVADLAAGRVDLDCGTTPGAGEVQS